MEPRPRSFAGLDCQPQVHPSVYLAESAELIGDVRIGRDSSVWPKCVLRGDINSIVIGEETNIQDATVIHLADKYGTKVGDRVTVGHCALLHACEIGDEVLVGMRATVMDGAVIGDRCLIGAGTLVTPGMEVPSGSLVLGSPGKVVRTLSVEEQDQLRVWADRYVVTAREYLNRCQK